MANEKNWHYRENIDIDGADDLETGQNWMFEFFTFLSGGADDTEHDGTWEIISASNASDVVSAWTGSGDVTFANDDYHSWFVAKSSSPTGGPVGLLPLTGAGGGRSFYLTVDCDQLDDEFASFYFDYNEPQFPGTTTARPAENSANVEYEQSNIQYRYSFDAGVGRTSYFHGIMDETGSFQIFSARSNDGYSNYPFSMGIHRVETPRSPDVDSYPVWMTCKYYNDANNHGCLSYLNLGVWNQSTMNRNGAYWNGVWLGKGGTAMWSGTGGNGGAPGYYCSLMFPGVVGYGDGFSIGFGAATTNYSQASFDLNGDDLDGSWPVIPAFVGNGISGYSGISYKSMRGRIADIKMGCGSYDWAHDPSGFTIPVSGAVEGCQIGSIMWPATEAWLPGT